MNRRLLEVIFRSSTSSIGNRMISSASAAITRIHRLTYNRVYPTLVVLPNGSTFEIRYHEPRAIIRLPIDMSLMTDDEKRRHLEKRKPKEKVKVVEEEHSPFNASKYVKKVSRKK